MANEDRPRVEVITGAAGRRYWPAQEKPRILEESLAPGEPISAVSRHNGVAPNLLFRWPRLMADRDAMAVGKDEPVVRVSEFRKLEKHVRLLERMLGRKTMEAESRLDALGKAGAKNRCGFRRYRRKTVPSKGLGRDRPREPLEAPWQGGRQLEARGRERKAGDHDVLSVLRRLVDPSRTYGYRRLTALLNRERRAAGLEPVNRKRVLRTLNLHGLTLEKFTGRREGRVSDGKVAVMASNLRWCWEAIEITCWNGEKVKVAFVIGAFNREMIAHVTVTRGG